MALPLPQLLKIMVDEGGTDLHITTNTAPIIRVHGKIKRIEHPPLSPAETKQVIYSILNDTQKHKFEEEIIAYHDKVPFFFYEVGKKLS